MSGPDDQHYLLLYEWWGADSAEDSLEEGEDGQDGWEGGEGEEKLHENIAESVLLWTYAMYFSLN